MPTAIVQTLIIGGTVGIFGLLITRWIEGEHNRVLHVLFQKLDTNHAELLRALYRNGN